MSKTDPAAAMAKLLQSLVEKAMTDIHVGLPCKVITFNEVTCTADVQPLIKTGDDDPAMILGVQALGQKLNIDGAKKVCKPDLASGDIVFVSFADGEIRNTLTGAVAKPDTTRAHDRNDAVIVGVFPCSLLN
ncbi:Gp138 family membrane-puncturing spike protein [Paenibacillus sp. FSL K6-1558]|uniref:Gp138 family membrane-puncturing spike protein n=1 Tax=Paenibacillus sp. FSL K6-1558 TaxID=2921473 RepID=UPI0030F5186C